MTIGPTYIQHHTLLKDNVRTNAFRDAIFRTVRPGDRVLEIGSGSGILSLFAAQAGASKVIAVELNTQMATLSKLLASDNGLANRIDVIAGDARTIEKLEPVDVLICDAMGFFGVSEEMDAFFQCRETLLKPGGRVIPEHVTMKASPACLPDVYDWLDFKTDQTFDVRLDRARSLSLASPYAVVCGPDNIMASPATLAEYDMHTCQSSAFTFDQSWTSAVDGLCHGLIGWYEAQIAHGVSLSSGPFIDRPMGRGRFFPFSGPVSLAKGQEVQIHGTITPTVSFWGYEISGQADTSSDCGSYTSLAAHPSWSRLGDDLSPKSMRAIERVSLNMLGYSPRVHDDIDLPDDLLGALTSIIEELHRDQNAGVFTGL